MWGKLNRLVAAAVFVGTALVPAFASAGFKAQLQGLSFGSTNWIAGNLSGWDELDLIPTRVFLSGGPANGEVITVQFDHTKSSGGTVLEGIQNLSQFVGSSNVTITSGPTLSDFSGNVWAYSFTVNLNDSNPGFVEFRSRLAAGAHNFPGSSLSMSGSPALGQLQFSKPAPSPGNPDLMIAKNGPSNANPGATITYNLTYTNLAGSAATGVQVTDVLPGPVTFVNCSGGCSFVGDTVIWDIGNLARGAGGSFTYQVTLDPAASGGSVFTNSAAVLSAENDANYSNNFAAVATTVTMLCVPPGIVSDPQNQSSCSGQPVSFQVGANGTSLQYQWRKNSVAIAGATNNSYTIASPGAADSGSYDVVITNQCGSATSAAATLDTSDTEPPTIVCPSNITVSCSADIPAADTNAVVASDNCSAVTVVFVGDTSDGQTCPETITRTYKAIDASGNAATGVQIITVHNQVAPVITCPANVQLECGASSDPANTGTANATDTCGGQPLLSYSDQTIAGGIQRTWTATDSCSNQASCVQTITFVDTTPPVITCPPNVQLSFGSSTDPSNTGSATATDTCDANPVVSYSDAPSAANCTGHAGIARTWTATDASGNAATCVQTITFVDTTPPVISCPANRQLECGASTDPSNTGSATATDDSGTAPTVSYTDLAIQNGIQRTWTATDACGNQASCIQTITFADTTPPVISCPANITVAADPGKCTASSVNLGTPTASDSCSSVSVSNDAPSTFPVGVTVVTWTATDSSGNTATGQQTVTVQDKEPPVITCAGDLTVGTDPGLQTASQVNLGTPSVTENCGTVTVSNDAPSVFPLGTTLVTWTATDSSGNTATCQQHVTVMDNQGPSLQCPADVVVAAAQQATNAVVEFQVPTASDNSGIASVVCTPPSGSTFPLGTNAVQCVATDLYGNTAQCTFHVIVQPTEILQETGPSDVDMYVSRGALLINWANHAIGTNADSLLIRGKMNPRGCTNNLTGATMSIRVNDTLIAPPAVLNAKGSFASANGAAPRMKGKFSSINGTYQFSIAGVNLGSVAGLTNATASGVVPLTIEIQISGAGLATPVVTGEFEFAYKSTQNRLATGKFSYLRNRTLTGAYNVNRTLARQVSGGYSFSAVGPILLDQSRPVIPTGDVIVTIGGKDIVIPRSSLARTGTSDATSTYTYNPKLGAVPGLGQFSINNRTKSFRLMTSELDGTGLPLPGNGAPIKYDLELAIDLVTTNGSAVADSVLEPKRTKPTSPSWKR